MWNIAFLNLSKRKLNIYKTKYIETILTLVGVEETLKRISLNSVVLCALIVNLHIQQLLEILKLRAFLHFLLTPKHKDMGSSEFWHKHSTHGLHFQH